MKQTKAMLAAVILILCERTPIGASQLSPRQVYERDAPAVVMVMGHSGKGGKGSGGTGTIVREDGLVLTNAHVVIEEATGKPYPRLTIFLKPERLTGNAQTDLSRSSAAVVQSYSLPLDLALLKIEKGLGVFPVIEMADSDHVHIGDRVVAIGHPEQGGLWTLTSGAISAEFENFNNVTGKHVFQTETSLNRGNSGGPLLDEHGHMIGINTAIARVAEDGLPIANISFALKSDVARQWLAKQGLLTMPVKAATDGPREGAQPSKSLPAASPPALSSPVPPPTIPQKAPDSLPLPPKPLPKPEAAPPTIQADKPRPYNLDKLISERERAEADLDDMIKEMRGRFQDR